MSRGLIRDQQQVARQRPQSQMWGRGFHGPPFGGLSDAYVGSSNLAPSDFTPWCCALSLFMKRYLDIYLEDVHSNLTAIDPKDLQKILAFLVPVFAWWNMSFGAACTLFSYVPSHQSEETRHVPLFLEVQGNFSGAADGLNSCLFDFIDHPEANPSR